MNNNKIQKITVLITLLTLCATLVSCGLLPSPANVPQSSSGSSISAKPGKLQPLPTDKTEPAVTVGPAEESVPEEQPSDADVQKTGDSVEVSLDTLMEYANSSTYLMEFAQKFFSNYIIYKNDGGQFTYKPVNYDLPLSDYNWDNLADDGTSVREKIYVEDGKITSIKGIDVSRHQGDIEWDKVAASGVEFAIIRLGYRGYSEGVLQLDPSFEANITGALMNDIDVGVYFWTQAQTEEEAMEEAQFILDSIKPYKITWPVVIDIEEGSSGDRTRHLTAAQRTDCVVAFCETIRKAGHTPMLYSNIRWFMDELELERLMDYDIWFAQYYNRPFFPYAFQMWQYTSSGKVNGIEGNVDLNLCFKDYRIKE